MRDLYKISNDEIDELELLVQAIKNTLKNHESLQRKLRLNNKINSILGEAIGLAKLHKAFGSTVEYCWNGKFKKDYDILVKNQKVLKKIQIKCSANDKFIFRAAKIQFSALEAKEIYDDVTKTIPSYEKMNQKIQEQMTKIDADAWLLLHM